MILETAEMSPDQIGRAALAMTCADNPHYLARQLTMVFVLTRVQRIALERLADLELERRKAEQV